MLQLTNGSIVEMPIADGTYTGGTTQTVTSNNCFSTGSYQYWPYDATHTVYWNSYPVYVCSDKTKKAIEILKTLQAEKKIRCDSVPKFIDLVEKIAAIL
jgi:hypothetical protein